MASSNLLLTAMLLALTASFGVASADGKADSDREDVPVKAEVELPKGAEETTEATGKQETAKEETARKEIRRKNQVDPNVDGLVLLACIVGLVVFIVVLRYMCCTIEQCEEKSKRSVERSLAARDKVENTGKEIILHGMKYKSLV